MTPVEIIAAVMAITTLLKFVMFGLDLDLWKNLARSMIKQYASMSWVCLVGALVVGYYLLQELSIVQLGAATLFGALLFGLFFTQYLGNNQKLLQAFVKPFLNNPSKFLKQTWVAVAAWSALSIWVLYALFM